MVSVSWLLIHIKADCFIMPWSHLTFTESCPVRTTADNVNKEARDVATSWQLRGLHGCNKVHMATFP